MGVGTDTMMPPKFGFVKTEGEFKPSSELQIHGTFPLEKILKKDPGMNAEELNRFPTQKYVETSSQSISSPFLVTLSGLSNHHEHSLFLSPFLVQQTDKHMTVDKLSTHPTMDALEEIFIPSDFYPLGKPYDESVMKDIIKKMMAQQVKKSETSTDQKYNNVEVSLQKPPTVSRPFSISNSRFQTSFGEDKYRLVKTLKIDFNLLKFSGLLI